MKSLNNLMRRLVALLLCACMLLGNMGVALSDTVDFLSDTFVPANYVSVRSSASGDTVPLSNYAVLDYSLSVDREGTPAEGVLQHGQFLLFRLAFKLKEQAGLEDLYLLRQAYRDGFVDKNTTFTVDVSFMNLLNNANYPTSYEANDNIASDNGVNIFRWWVDEASGKVCLRFYEAVYTDNGSISNTSVAFEGTLDASGRDNNGELHFGVDGKSSSLKVRQDYKLAKTAGVPYFSTDASSYLVDYTVTLELKQDMKLSSDSAAATADLYSAALTLVDTVQADGALEGEIYGVPVVTSPTGVEASVSVAKNGTTNTLTFASKDQILKQGTYTIVYKMKLDSAAALAKLENYTDEQKKNIVEVKENGASLPTPVTADATIAWNNVTEDQYKIDKNAFTEKAPHFKGVYLDEANRKYYIDFRVVVYIREEVSTFTVTDHADYALTFQGAPAPTLEGVDTSETYWTNDVSTATLIPLTGENEPTVESSINTAGELVTIVTAPAGKKLQPGAYHLRVPADVTAAVNKTLEQTYPQSYQNTVHLTSVDKKTTQESKMFKQAIPNRTEPRKDGGFVVQNGQMVLHEGKPVIRWDVWIGWDFYDTTTFEDTMTGMELLIDDNEYRFEIHSFTDMNHMKEGELVSLTTRADQTLNGKIYLDFNEEGNGFTFYAHNLDKNSDNTPVKMYKLVYFTTPVSNADGTYQTNGLKNNYTVTHLDPFGNGFVSGPDTGEVVPGLTGNALLSVNKQHLIEVNDLVTSWKITVSNTNNIPFNQLGHLEILDVVPPPEKQGTNGDIGEVTVFYSDEYPISVLMTMPGVNEAVTLVENTHYTISRSHSEYALGENGKYGFVVSLNQTKVAELLADNGVDRFETIQVFSYLRNERRDNDKSYRIYNEGHIDYSNLNVELHDSHTKYYDRVFSTKTKGEHPYDDFYNPNSHREFFVCNLDENGIPIGKQSFTGGYDFNPATGDGQKEIVWRIKIGAQEFGNDDNPIQVTVTDTFSDNQMFPTYDGMDLEDQFLIRAENDGYRDYIILPDSVSVDGNSFTLVFTVPGGGWAGGSKDNSKNITIDYHTILKPEAIKEAVDGVEEDDTSVIVAYHNTATVGWHGDSYTIPTTTSSAEFSTIMLNKTSKIVTAVSEIEYSILINQDRLPLNGGKPLVLTDTLGAGKENFLYRDDTVQLVNLDTDKVLTAGSTVSDSTYTITWATGETKGFIIQVPDGQRLQLTYRVKPQAAVGDETGDLINSASLDGQVSSHTRDSFKVSASNQEGSYQIPENTVVVNIMKKEGDVSIIVPLEGAVFAAYPVHADGSLGAEVKTCTTVADGSASFEFERDAGIDGYGTVYCIKEKTPPVGYHLTDDEWYFYFSMSSTPDKEYANDEVKTIVERLKADPNNVVYNVLNEESYLLNVDNLPITSDLRIYKTSSKGDPLTGAVFALQDANGNQMPAPTVSDGCYTFANLKGGTYTLTETKAPDGYQLSTPNSWTIQLAAGGDEEANTVSVVWPEDATEAMKKYVVVMSDETVSGETVPSETVPSLTVRNDAAAPAKLSIPVTKMLDGAVTTEQAFTFTMAAVTEGAPMPAPASRTASTAGATYNTKGETEVHFGEITYPYACVGNTYEYKITENQVNASTGFTGDASEYHVTVKVEWKNGQVVASIQSITKNGEEAEKVAFTNAYVPYVPYTSVTVTKIWDDNGDQDGKRSGVVATVALMKTVGTTTEQVGEAVTVGTTDNWSTSWNELPVYEGGEAITYSVKEEMTTANGYTSNAGNGVTVTNGAATITNSYTPKVTSITVNKKWNDNGDQDGKRSGVVAKVTLMKTVGTTTSQVGDAVTVGTTDNWSTSWNELPVYEGGEAITYSVKEEMTTANGYTSNAGNGVTVTNGAATIINTHTPEAIDISGTKTWDDAKNQDGLRPTIITVNLLADGTIIDTATVKADANGEWTWSFDDLPKYKKQGTEIVYSITETLDEKTAAAYTATVDGYNITNTHTPATVDVTGSKVWIDLNNAYHTRPESITIRLLADGTEIAEQEANAENNWSWSFTELPKYAVGQVGHEITYTVTEDSVPGYVTSQSGYNFTNTVQVVAFQKLDEQTGKPLSGAGFALYEGRLTAASGTPLMTWTSTSEPKVLAGLTTGKTYTILETKAPFGFTPMTPFVFTVQDTDTPAAMRTFTANNRHSYRFRKLSTSNNELVYGAEMAIMQGDTTIATWFTNYENDGWHYVADKRFKAGVTYTLVELSAPNGYQLASPIAFSIDPNDGFLIVNGQDTNDMSMVMFDQPVPSATPGPEPTTTSFRVTKRWEDQDNVLGLRPSSIVVNLYQKTSNEASYPETPYLTVTMTSDGTDEWDFTFNDLPRRDGNGRLYNYMAQEEPVEGYVASYLNNGRTIVNSIPEEDLPPTPTPTLPYVTPTPSPMPRVPAGVQFINGRWVYVDEYGVPLGGVPLTGDTTNFALWGAAIVLPMIIAALAAVEIRRRKRRMAVEGTEE